MKGKRLILLFIPVVVLVVLVYVLWGREGEEVSFTYKNLALNSGFETLDSSGKPNLWKEDPQGGWKIDAKGSYQGQRSSRNDVVWSWLSQEVPVRAKTYYSLRAQVKSDITLPDKEDYYNTFLTLECLNWRKKVIKREWGIVNATSSWHFKENSILTPPGTRKIRIKLAKRQGEGSVWFDEVELTKVSVGLVLNPGFDGTVFGKLNGQKIGPYTDSDGTTIHSLNPGSREGAISAMHKSYRMGIWIFRLVGFLMMWIGLMALFAPISTILDIVPFFGGLSRGIVKFITFFVSLILSLVTILISIILHSLLAVIIGVLIVIAIVAVVLKKKGKNVKPPTPKPAES